MKNCIKKIIMLKYIIEVHYKEQNMDTREIQKTLDKNNEIILNIWRSL
jgi:hypothetical protein